MLGQAFQDFDVATASDGPDNHRNRRFAKSLSRTI